MHGVEEHAGKIFSGPPAGEMRELRPEASIFLLVITAGAFWVQLRLFVFLRRVCRAAQGQVSNWLFQAVASAGAILFLSTLQVAAAYVLITDKTVEEFPHWLTMFLRTAPLACIVLVLIGVLGQFKRLFK